MTFMKTFWAALLACVVSGIVLTVLFFLILAGMASAFGDSAPELKANTVLKIDLAHSIQDSPDGTPFSVGFTGLSFSKKNTLVQVIAAIQKAGADSNIKGIVIDLAYTGTVTLANLEEIRQAIEDFKSTGKFVVSYGDYYHQIGYYLASVADYVIMNPAGSLDWRGMSMGVMFYKGLLDKLGVKPEVIRHGSFKSAVEPYILDSMSPENRLQYTTLVESIWDTILEDVSRSRGIETYELSDHATKLTLRTAADALEHGFVDALAYQDQVEWFIKELVAGADPERAMDRLRSDSGSDNADEDAKLRTISLSSYIDTGVSYGRRTSKNKVALIYAEGSIVDVGSSDEVVGREVAAKLARARTDEGTKAVVLRVNSPGGSALASEVIWREMELTRAVKPVIVSMGGLAASGGYYISCPADIILTDRTTLTGSIGVFGILFDISGALKDKLGVTVDVVRSNPSADLGSMYRGLSAVERDAIQEGVEEIYDTFVGHVAAGRNMSWDEVDDIGQGRVWTGTNALELGLADGIGSLNDAIELAADRAGITDDFRLWQIVQEPDQLTNLLMQLGGVRTQVPADELGELYMEYKAVKEMVEKGGIQARMPYTFIIE